MGMHVSSPDGVKFYNTDEDAVLVPAVTRVRAGTAAALPANTRVGNRLIANANGALGTIDGVTDLAPGNLLLVQNEATGANNGVYLVESLGGASSKWQLKRAPSWDVTVRIKAGRLVVVSEGTANGNTLLMLSTDDPIVLNTTALVFTAL